MVDAHFSCIWRYLVGLGVPVANADDAAQQVFIVAAEKILTIERGSERSFLVSTAHGVAANMRRAAGRRREVQAPSLDLRADETPDPEQNAESHEAAAILDAFLVSLSGEVRSVFMLFELEGMTMVSIAETLSIPPGTVASRLRRAREEFHEMARRVQMDSPSHRGRGGRA
jgi:RNA polymerase sigma-70 factor, ECF subfamily